MRGRPLPDPPPDPTVEADLAEFLAAVTVERDDEPAPDIAQGSAHLDAAVVDAAVGALDLTSLAPDDTPAAIAGLCRTAQRPDPVDPGCPAVAAVCTWPDLVPVAAVHLAGSPVRLAAVAGAFPHARTFDDVAAAEVAAALAAGADEVDVVIDRALLAAGRPGAAVARLARLRQAAGAATMKVILETGALGDEAAIRAAAWTAALAGADMLKTSTGKQEPAATPQSVRVLLAVARDAEALLGRPIGVKAAGGIRTPSQAATYLHLARQIRGRGHAGPDRLRLGASSLLGELVRARRPHADR